MTTVDLDEREERFRDLYDTMRTRVVSYALRRTPSPEDAADVVAEVFAIAWRRLDDLPQDESGLLWLYATARRVITNRGRKVLRQNEVLEKLHHQARRSFTNPAQRDLGQSLLAVRVLSQLGETDREILMLAGWEGLNSAQLGRTLQCSPVAARLRLHRARTRLSAALASSGLETDAPAEVPATGDRSQTIERAQKT